MVGREMRAHLHDVARRRHRREAPEVRHK